MRPRTKSSRPDENYAESDEPPRASLAMMHLAMHDAVNAAQPRYTAYAYTERDSAADPAVAAVTAAHDVLAALYPKQAVLLKTALDESLRRRGHRLLQPRAVSRSERARPQRCSRSVPAMAALQGAAALPARQRPGEYRFTPGFDFSPAPHWRNVAPFTLKAPSQFRSAPPPALDQRAVRARLQRSQDQPAARPLRQAHPGSNALFGLLVRVLRHRLEPHRAGVARDQLQDLWQRARTFALVNAAMADAYIAGWDSKLHYNLWRPVTAIRLADADGNAQTAARRRVHTATRPRRRCRTTRRRTARLVRRRRRACTTPSARRRHVHSRLDAPMPANPPRRSRVSAKPRAKTPIRA